MTVTAKLGSYVSTITAVTTDSEITGPNKRLYLLYEKISVLAIIAIIIRYNCHELFIYYFRLFAIYYNTVISIYGLVKKRLSRLIYIRSKMQMQIS